jgi:hypothetical protein
VACLEWALNEAYFAADATPVDPAALNASSVSELLDLRPVLHPSCRLIASPYPVDRIWVANRQQDGEEIVDLASGPARLLVFRDADDVGWRRLNEGAFAFLTAIAEGASLRAAAGAAAAAATPFDIAALLTQLGDACLFVQPANGAGP